MKKILLVLIMLAFSTKAYAVITTESYITPEDISIARMESNRQILTDGINSADGGLLQAGTVPASALTANANPQNRWNEAFNDFVYTGLLAPTTSGTLTSTTTLGTAYVDGVRVVKDATSNAYTATKWTYVDLSSNGTYTYPETVIGASEPSTSANSIRLCRVSSDATQVTAVRDDRVTSVQLETNEDFYRSGLSLTTTATATVTVSPGVCYHGTTRISKTADTALALGTASDWDTGVSSRATSTKGYVVVDVGGNIKLSITAPTKTDTSGNSAGDLRYSVVSSTYWRVLGSFYMNATGSGDVSTSTTARLTTDLAGPSDWGDTRLAGSTIQVQSVVTGIMATGSTAMVYDDTIPQITEGDEYMTLAITPTSATNMLKIEVVLYGASSGTSADMCALFQDATAGALAGVVNTTGTANYMAPFVFTHPMVAGTTSATTFRVRAGSAADVFTFNGSAVVRKFGGVMASSITITEVKS